MGFLKSLFGMDEPEVEPLPETPVNPDDSRRRGWSALFGTGRRASTSPLGDTSTKTVRKTRLGE